VPRSCGRRHPLHPHDPFDADRPPLESDLTRYALSPSSGKPSITWLRCFPTLRRAAHGPRPQLRHRRRSGPLHWMSGTNVLHPMAGFLRLPAENAAIKHQRQPASGRSKTLLHEDADEASRLQLRLVARNRDLPPRVLPLEPVVFLKLFEKGLPTGKRARSIGVPTVPPCSPNEQGVDGCSAA